MLVQCETNQISNISADSAIGEELRRSVGTDFTWLTLTVGGTYTVYAVEIRNGYPWYFVADDLYDSLSYPLAYAAVLFRESDNRVSRCWNLRLRGRGGVCGQTSNALFTFKEWAESETFFELLIGGNDRELQIFREYKAFMDMEYPSPSVTEAAEEVDGAWLMCTRCSEAWESESILAMIRCPKCCAILLNPRYSPNIYRDA